MISGIILLGLMDWYNFVPSWRIVTLPLFILMAAGASMGVGLWMATLNVKYRDFSLHCAVSGAVRGCTSPRWALAALWCPSSGGWCIR